MSVPTQAVSSSAAAELLSPPPRHSRRFTVARSSMAWLVVLALLLLLPSLLSAQWLSVAVQALLLSFGALGLVLLAGYGGLFSLASAGLTAAGATALAVLCVKSGLPVPLGLLGAGFTGAALGLIIGVPALRLRGLYLLLSTLAANFILLYIFDQYVNKQFGVAGILYNPLTIFGIKISDDTHWYYTLLPVIALLMVFVSNVKHTSVGRGLFAMKQNEVSAAASGIDVPRLKLTAFMASSIFTAVGGAFYGLYYLSLNGDYFTLQASINYYAALIIGGQYFAGGAVVGCVFVAGAPVLLQNIAGHFGGGWLSTNSAELANILFGVAVIGILLLRPDGLWSIVEWVQSKVWR